MSATDYSRIVDAVDKLISAPADVNDPTTRAYMIARAAILSIRAHKGEVNAAELCYRLGDEMVNVA